MTAKVSKVSEVLAALRSDHRNMAMLLRLMEHEIQRVEDDEEPDFELLHDIMHYMAVYADAIHHPREDLVYAEMRSRGGGFADGLDGIEPDHEEIAVLSIRLRNDFDAVISGTAVQREQVIGDADEYTRRLRDHMQWEESDLFKRADRMCAEDRSASVDVSHLSANDPVFGGEAQSPFAKLFERVRLEARTALP